MNFDTEQKYIKQGYDFVIGIDEAGRGPLAGPVVATAVAICHSHSSCHSRPSFCHPPGRTVRTGSRGGGNPEIACPNAFRRASSLAMTNNLDSRSPIVVEDKFHGEALVLDTGDDNRNYFVMQSGLSDVKDSKKLSPKKREKLFELLTQNPDIKYGIGIVLEKIIDKENILQATLMAMEQAVKNLCSKEPKINLQNGIILIDGKDILENLDFGQHSIINGDNKVWSIAAASIIAKVTRDRIMQKYHKKYPQYCFDKHKGYGTKLHFEMIAKYGPCKIHRKSFLN